jgi:hypothetical protein
MMLGADGEKTVQEDVGVGDRMPCAASRSMFGVQ